MLSDLEMSLQTRDSRSRPGGRDVTARRRVAGDNLLQMEGDQAEMELI
jgi:hypothetical protein